MKKSVTWTDSDACGDELRSESTIEKRTQDKGCAVVGRRAGFRKT